MLPRVRRFHPLSSLTNLTTGRRAKVVQDVAALKTSGRVGGWTWARKRGGASVGTPGYARCAGMTVHKKRKYKYGEMVRELREPAGRRPQGSADTVESFSTFHNHIVTYTSTCNHLGPSMTRGPGD